MITEIKRLQQRGKEFVPITLAEAVVVNTGDHIKIPGIASNTITTLDKVLGILGIDFQAFLTALAGKQDALTAGSGIVIKDGVISTNNNFTLYKIVTPQEFKEMIPSQEHTNQIYIVLTNNTPGNSFSEFVCLSNNILEDGVEKTIYFWEKLGEVVTQVDLSGYVTNEQFNQFIGLAITATPILTSTNQQVIANYSIPTDLYDNMVVIDSDLIEIQ